MGATYTRQSSAGIVDGGVIEASDLNDEFDQLVAARAVTTGHTHDGTTAEGGPVTKLLGNTLTFGAGTAGTDITITFDGETPQPDVITLETSGSGAIFGSGQFGTAVYGLGDLPITRKTEEGSGFAVALKLTDTTSNLPWAIKGFEMEFTPGGRR